MAACASIAATNEPSKLAEATSSAATVGLEASCSGTSSKLAQLLHCLHSLQRLQRFVVVHHHPCDTSRVETAISGSLVLVHEAQERLNVSELGL